MNHTIRSTAAGLALAAAAASLTGCVVYDPYYPYPYAPYPYTAASTASTYDRSWNAAVGAMRDQGVTILRADRGHGVIDGQWGGVSVTTVVQAQPDGRVQVATNTSDANLAQGLSRSYDIRMGR